MPTSKRTVKAITAATVKTETSTTRQTRSQTKELISAFENLDIKQVDKLIFDRGFDPSVVSPELLTRSLWHAVKMQNAPLVRELLKHKPKLKVEEEPMLSLAVKSFNVDIAKMLIDAGADVNETDYLHAVALCQDTKMHELAVPLMERGADLNTLDVHNKSVLCYAIENEALDIVEALLRRGVKIREDECEIVLPIVGNSTKAAELLKLLFDHDCVDIETRDRLAWIAIVNLIEHEPDKVDEVEKLLELGVPIDQANQQGITALHYAVNLNRPKMVELLLTQGADVNKKTHRGTTPIMLAARSCQPPIAVSLIKRGANIHDCNNGCRYPVHFACDHGASQNIRLLVNLGASVDVIDQWDFTPFSLLRDSSAEKTEILLKHFAFLAAKGVSLDCTDLATIKNDGYLSAKYDLCMKELQRMKDTEFMSGVTYFDLLNGKIERLSLLAKNSEFVEQFRKSQKNANGKSPRWLKYSREVNVAFRMAEMRRDLLVEREELVRDALKDVLPQIVLDKIARYMLEDFGRFRRDFYLSLFSK